MKGTMTFTRRALGRLAVITPLARTAFGAGRIDSKVNGVQLGAITYSFNRIAQPDPEAIGRAYTEIGLGEAELMSNHCEALAGAPAVPNISGPEVPVPGDPQDVLRSRPSSRPSARPPSRSSPSGARAQAPAWICSRPSSSTTASSDATAEIAESFSRVSCIRQENGGAAAARNAGAAAANGEFVANFDSTIFCLRLA